MTSSDEQRLLVLAPTGRDAALACELLGRAGLDARAVRDVEALCTDIAEGAAAVLIAEEALSPHALELLSQTLGRQPTWSDLPIILFASAVESRTASARMEQMVERLGNVTFVDRPVRSATLVTVMRAALRARNRQYGARELLRAVEREEVETRKRADFEQYLIGIVSHDLRNPLTAIRMGTSSLVRFANLDERQLKGLLRIHNAAERAIRMVSDLLDFTQARLGGGVNIAPRDADLREIAQTVLDELEAAHPARELRFEVEGDTRGHWDSDRLAQVIQNLVNNALKYSPEESPVGVTLCGEETAVVLAVHNAGAPIPAEKLGMIFEPLRRASQEVSRHGRSVGLGLYIVAQVVQAHGGSVSATSNAEAGTRFEVRLPRRAPAPAGETRL